MDKKINQTNKIHLNKIQVIVTICAIFILCLFAWRVFILLNFPFPHDYSEASILQATILWQTNGILYSPFEQMPMVHIAYPPLFMSLLYYIDKPENILLVGRFISLLGTVVCVLIIYLNGQLKYKSLAFGFSVLWLSMPEIYRMGVMLRVDMAALACLGLSIFFYEKKKHFLVVLFLSLAILFKHSAIVLPVLLLYRQIFKEEKVWFKIIYLIPLLVLGTLFFGQRGDHIFYYHLLEEDFSRFTPLFVDLSKHGFILLLFCLFCAIKIERKYLLWSISSFVLACLMFSKPGSELIYGMECLFALILGMRKSGTPENKVVIACTLLIAGLFINLPLPKAKVMSRVYANTSAPASSKGSTPDENDYENAKNFMNVLKSTEGRILSENPAWTNLSGHQPEISPFQLKHLSKKSVVSEAPIINHIQNHTYAIVISEGHLDETENRYFSESIRSEVLRHYTLNQVFGNQYIYIPNR